MSDWLFPDLPDKNVRFEISNTQYGWRTIMSDKHGKLINIEDGVRVTAGIYDGNKSVGAIVFTYSVKHRIGEIESIIIHEQRQGYGRQAVKWAENYMSTKRVTRFYVAATGFDILYGSTKIAFDFWKAMEYKLISSDPLEQTEMYKVNS